MPMQIHVWDTSGVGICVSKYIEISSWLLTQLAITIITDGFTEIGAGLEECGGGGEGNNGGPTVPIQILVWDDIAFGIRISKYIEIS